MKILAIDPGTTESAWVEYETFDKRIIASGKEPNAEIFKRISFHQQCFSEDDPIVVEMIASYGMAVGKEVFETVLWIGRFYQHALISELNSLVYTPRPPTLVYRMEVKNHLCHSARAKDGNIRQALIDLIGPQGTKKNPGPTYGLAGDMWAALGVAVTAAAKMESKS